MVIFKSHWPDVVIPQDVGLTDFLLDRMKLYQDRVATIDSQSGEKKTFSELHHQILNTASSLHKQGFQKNDVMAILSINSIGYSLISFASVHLGGAFVGINIKYTIDDMMRQFEICQPKFLAFSPQFQSIAEEIQKNYTHLKKVFIMGQATNDHESLYSMAQEAVSLPEIKREPKKDVAVFYFSSGTTGLPKAVPCTQYQMLVSILRHGPDGPRFIPDNHIFSLITPMNHILSLVSSLDCWCNGNTVVYFLRYDFPKMLEGIEKFKINAIIVVSTIANSFAYDPIVDNYDLGSLKMCIFGVAPISEEVLSAAQKRLNIPSIRKAYGMTETLACTHFTYPGEENSLAQGNVGRLLPNTLCKIVDEESGHELNKNEKGEIWIKVESIMSGYINNPEATEAGFAPGGWWRTGDYGYVDDQENLFVLDRIKDMIKVYGEQVSPSALEDTLLKHPAVSEATVIGVPDAELGEVPRAFVVLKAGEKTVTKGEILEYVNSQVADFQQIRGGVEFIDQIPKNALNKVLRRELRMKFSKDRQGNFPHS